MVVAVVRKEKFGSRLTTFWWYLNNTKKIEKQNPLRYRSLSVPAEVAVRARAGVNF